MQKELLKKASCLSFLLMCGSSVFAASSVMPHFDWQTGDHFFGSIGVQAYQFIGPPQKSLLHSTRVNTTAGNSAKSLRIRKTALKPTASFGYAFTNTGFGSSIMGRQNKVTLHYTSFSVNDSRYYYLFGAGKNYMRLAVNGNRIGGSSLVYVKNYKMNNKVNVQDVDLTWSGHKRLSDSISMQPSIGLVFMSMKQHYRENLIWWGGVGQDFPLYYETRLRTAYYGLSFGDTFTFHINQKMSASLGLTAQALGIRTTMRATSREINNIQPSEQTVRDKQSTFNYQAIAQASFRYAFFNKDNSPYVTFMVGVDNWGYMAYVRGPKLGEAAKIGHAIVFDPFLGIEFTIPFV